MEAGLQRCAMHVCVSATHECVSAMHVCVSAMHVCVSAMHVCVSAMHECVSATHVQCMCVYGEQLKCFWCYFTSHILNTFHSDRSGISIKKS